MSPTLRMTLFIQNYDCWRNTSFQRRVFLLIVYVDPHLDCLVLSIGSLSGTLFQFCKSITVLTANNQEYMYVKCPSILYSNRETKDRFAQCFPSNSYSIYCTNIRPELYPQEYVSSLLTIHHSKYDNIIVLIKKSPMLLKYISFVYCVFIIEWVGGIPWFPSFYVQPLMKRTSKVFLRRYNTPDVRIDMTKNTGLQVIEKYVPVIWWVICRAKPLIAMEGPHYPDLGFAVLQLI